MNESNDDEDGMNGEEDDETASGGGEESLDELGSLVVGEGDVAAIDGLIGERGGGGGGVAGGKRGVGSVAGVNGAMRAGDNAGWKTKATLRR